MKNIFIMITVLAILTGCTKKQDSTSSGINTGSDTDNPEIQVIKNGTDPSDPEFKIVPELLFSIKGTEEDGTVN